MSRENGWFLRQESRMILSYGAIYMLQGYNEVAFISEQKDPMEIRIDGKVTLVIGTSFSSQPSLNKSSASLLA